MYSGPALDKNIKNPSLNCFFLLRVQYPDIQNLIIKTKTIRAILKGLNINKSTGPDELPPIVLKPCSPEFAPIVAKFYRRILHSASFPDTWKQANIHPVTKKGDKSDPANYSPINIKSILYKIF